MIGTDQNFNYLEIERHVKTRELLDLFISSGFLPTVTLPTRITHSSSTLIDNIYVKCRNLDHLVSGIITSDLSDHLPLFTFLGKPTREKPPPKTITFRPIDEEKLSNIKNYLDQYNWNFLFDLDPDTADDQFTKILQNALNTYMPEKTMTIPNKHILRQPWMTPALLKSSKHRDIIFRKCLNKPKNSICHKNYTIYRNTYNKLKKICKQNYYAHELTLCKSDLKKTWNILKSVIGKTNDKSGIPETFRIGANLIKDPKTIADKFCQYFAEIGPEFASKIPQPSKLFHSHLKQAKQNSFFMKPTDPNEILKIIMSLKPKNSTGHDGISSKLLKYLAPSLAFPITTIVNKSFETGIVPSKMKIAKIIPIYKAKDKMSMGNYRPISLLPATSNILEKAVHSRLYSYLKSKNILFGDQYGFHPNHSTIDAVAKFTGHVYSALENKETTMAVFLDLSKAFDTVDAPL